MDAFASDSDWTVTGFGQTLTQCKRTTTGRHGGAWHGRATAMGVALTAG